jgi:superfamily II DNA/RNA helicase
VECDVSMRAACLKYLLLKEYTNYTTQHATYTPFQVLLFTDGYTHDTIDTLLQLLLTAFSNNTNIYKIQYLSNDASLDIRAKVLNEFRTNECSILLCTDAAARGLDIPGVNLILQMSLPNNIDTYVHRVGRTGRLGRYGKTITFISTGEEFVIQRYYIQ